MDIAEKTKRAKVIAEATGVSFSKAFKAVEDHPDPVPNQGNNVTAETLVVTDPKKTAFWKKVESHNLANKCRTYDSILAVRKSDPELFNEYLEVANR